MAWSNKKVVGGLPPGAEVAANKKKEKKQALSGQGWPGFTLAVVSSEGRASTPHSHAPEKAERFPRRNPWII